MTATQITDFGELPIPESEQEECRDSELGNARRLIQLFGEDLRYSHKNHQWYVWDGKRWVADEMGLVRGKYVETIRLLLQNAASIDDLDQRKKETRWALKSESNGVAIGSLAMAQHMVPIDFMDFDKDEWLLSLNNGVLDLKTQTLREHRREDLISKMVPYDYDPSATCPRWERFLQEIMPKQNATIIPFLQRAFGYSLTGSTREHCLFLLYGTGRNGKGKFVETMRYVLGDTSAYAANAGWQSFTFRKNGGAEVREDIARLTGMRIVTAAESDQHIRLAESLIKALTGGDKITARHLYHGSFEFFPMFKIWLATNYEPNIIGQDEGIWSRIRKIPFVVTIPEAQRDPDLGEKLKAEAPGILNWALQGLQQYLKTGLDVPTVIREATDEYRRHSDQVNRFIDSTCSAAENARVSKGLLYARYQTWAEEVGESYVKSRKEFEETLKNRGFLEGRDMHGMIWRGVTLAEHTTLGAARTEPAEAQDETQELEFGQ